MAQVFRDNQVHVLSEKCASCIFKPKHKGRILGLAPGRVAGMVLRARGMKDGGGNIPCHMTIHSDKTKPAICRGFWDLPRRPSLLQVAERLGIVVYDPPPTEY